MLQPQIVEAILDEKTLLLRRNTLECRQLSEGLTMGERVTFSLLMFLGLITVTALGCFALVNRSPWAASIVVSLTLATLGIGVLLAIVFRRATRIFWVAFSLTGGVYMLFSMHPWFANFGASMASTRVLVFAWTQVDKHSPVARTPNPMRFSNVDVNEGDLESLMDSYGMVMLQMKGLGAADENFREYRSFVFIGQSLWAVLFGFLAGLFCGIIYTVRSRNEEINNRKDQPRAPPGDVVTKEAVPDSPPFLS
ncbi:MAG: hypothetical protein IH991_15515 [Planctomycetes bacterium]|nr:hypothetical protein [Planctomycetota bacterium]